MDADPKSPLQDGRSSAFHAATCSLSSLLDSVICGDNCETLAATPAESVDLVVTSPPYDDIRTYGGHSWDFERLAGELTRVLKPGGVIVWVVADATINGSETLTSMRQAIHFKDVCGLNVHDTMIYKQAGTGAKGSNLAYWQAWEFMFVLAKGKPKSVNRIKDRKNAWAGDVVGAGRKKANGETKDKKQRITADVGIRENVWRYTFDMQSAGHPAPFPQALASDHIQSWSNPGDVVLDPFAGSGTTLKAAKELGRRFIGIEINPEYVAICKRRIAQDVLPLFSDNA
jgi:DNA modification methylase